MTDDAVGICPRCGGEGVIGAAGAVLCPLCKGLGQIGDSGPAPEVQAGLCAFKACGCAADWIGDGAAEAFRLNRTELWVSQGWTWRAMDFSEAAPLITSGNNDCTHEDRRATPRQAIGAPALDDVVGGVIPPMRPKIVDVEIDHLCQSTTHGGVESVCLSLTLENGETRLVTAWLEDPEHPQPPTGPEGK